MGSATINSGGPVGLYDITLVKNTTQATRRVVTIDRELSAITPLLVSKWVEVLNAEADVNSKSVTWQFMLQEFVAGTKAEKDVDDARTAFLAAMSAYQGLKRAYAVLTLSKLSLQKEKAMIEAAIASEVRPEIWCTDLSEALSGTVGTIEIDGEKKQVIIMPGGKRGLGILHPAAASTPSGVFVNWAKLAWWQKVRPTYRIGEILEVYEETDKADVLIYPAFSSVQCLPINKEGVAYKVAATAVTGFADFASKNPTNPLVTNTGDSKITTTPQALADIANVNDLVNDRHSYKTDKENYGILENWTIMSEGGTGDCEDFALTKADKLLALGYPASAIKVEIGVMPNGEGHAWLVVQTTTGDLILDNDGGRPKSPAEVPYTDRRRQTGAIWERSGLKLENVPVEYMDGINASAFNVADRVVVEFGNQSWNAPKVIGFESHPKAGFVSCLIWAYMKSDRSHQIKMVRWANGVAATIDDFSFLMGDGPLLSWHTGEQKYLIFGHDWTDRHAHVIDKTGAQTRIISMPSTYQGAINKFNVGMKDRMSVFGLSGSQRVAYLLDENGAILHQDNTSHANRYYYTENEYAEFWLTGTGPFALISYHYVGGVLARSYQIPNVNADGSSSITSISHKANGKVVYVFEQNEPGNAFSPVVNEVRLCNGLGSMDSYMVLYAATIHPSYYVHPFYGRMFHFNAVARCDVAMLDSGRIAVGKSGLRIDGGVTAGVRIVAEQPEIRLYDDLGLYDGAIAVPSISVSDYDWYHLYRCPYVKVAEARVRGGYFNA